jgi:hypothetical protein
MLLEFALRRIAVALHARSLTSPQVRPSDEPHIRSGASEPIRVLLLGSGITSGWGVHTFGLALVGQLQQALQRQLRAPVDVEQVSQVGASITDAVSILGTRATERWDAIVVAFGLSDAMRLTPTRDWAQAMDRLLAKLDGDMPPGPLVPIVIAGMPETEAMGLMTPLRVIFRKQPDRLNEMTQRTVSRNRRTTYAPMPPMAEAEHRPEGSPQAYQLWAEALTTRLTPLLGDVSASVSSSRILVRDTRSTVEVAPAEAHASTTTTRGRARFSRTRLKTEGSTLTRSATRRSMPAGLDVRIVGPAPIRVLVVGGEYAVGFGTHKREDALDGAIAGLLHLRTGRGVIVENRSQHLVRLEQLAASLGPSGAHTYDVVIWTPTFIEATRILLRARIITGISLMLRRIQSTSTAGVVLVGFPSLLGHQPLAVVGRARAGQINKTLRTVAARFTSVVVAEPPAITLATVDTVSGMQTYHDAAVAILPAIMKLIPEQTTKTSPLTHSVHPDRRFVST